MINLNWNGQNGIDPMSACGVYFHCIVPVRRNNICCMFDGAFFSGIYDGQQIVLMCG